jgi:DNA primase
MIVEGYFDLLMLHQSGLRQSVATLGTALTAHHLRLLRRYTERMVLVFDGDAAGQQASLRLLPLFLEEGLWPKVVLLPEGEDPDGFLRKGHLEDFKRRIAEGPLLMDFFLDRLAKIHPVKSVEGRAKCADEALAMIQRIPDVIQRDFYLKALAERLELEVSLLRNRIGRGLKGRLRTETGAQGPLSQRYDSRAEETVVRLMTQDPRWVGRVLEERIIDEFESPSLQQIARAMEEVYRRRGDLPLSEVMAGLEETLQEKLRRIIFKEVVFEEGIEEKILEDCVQKIRERRLKRDKSELRKRIREAEKETGGEVPEALLAEHQALARREALLRKSGP